LTRRKQSVSRKRELMNLYDTTASIYNTRYTEIQYKKYEYVREFLSKQDTLLDVGCGTGLLFHDLNSSAGSLVGVDISTKMLKIALISLKTSARRIDLLSADADSLPFRNNTFTKVTSVTVLQNMPEPCATIKEIARVTSVGGHVALTCLKKKHDLSSLRRIILTSAAGLNITSEWDSGEEDIGVNTTKLI
jgi:ubiquinone/menaquinone biosynthesis C-methylase UbiE